MNAFVLFTQWFYLGLGTFALGFLPSMRVHCSYLCSDVREIENSVACRFFGIRVVGVSVLGSTS